MRIAMVGHSYHLVTRSSQFFADLLRNLGEVVAFWDDAWTGSISDWLNTFDPSSFNCIVVWQWSQLLHDIPDLLAKHGNVIVVPMYDDVVNSSPDIWPRIYSLFKIICFSSTLYDDVARYSSKARYFKYFPNPASFTPIVHGSELSAFFWRRTNQITESTLANLCSCTTFDTFTIHFAPDPCIRSTCSRPALSLSTREFNCSSWFENKADYLRTVARHRVYFAPRLNEGIGMAFLEAMAMGLCVVAPNTPTHNEYIVDRNNGLLYDSERSKLDFTSLATIGINARATIEMGYQQWISSQDELLSFVSSPI